MAQDPVKEEMRRKDEKPAVSVRRAKQLAEEHFGLRPPHILDGSSDSAGLRRA